MQSRVPLCQLLATIVVGQRLLWLAGSHYPCCSCPCLRKLQALMSVVSHLEPRSYGTSARPSTYKATGRLRHNTPGTLYMFDHQHLHSSASSRTFVYQTRLQQPTPKREKISTTSVGAAYTPMQRWMRCWNALYASRPITMIHTGRCCCLFVAILYAAVASAVATSAAAQKTAHQ